MECDPLDPDTWPEGYICVPHGEGFILEKAAKDKKEGPYKTLIIGGLLGLALGMVLVKK